jgi:hypothetical protein
MKLRGSLNTLNFCPQVFIIMWALLLAFSVAPLRAQDTGSAAAFGKIVPVYNLPDGGGSLHFTPKVIAEVFLGQIEKWDDPQIAQLNPGLSLPHLDIIVVHRADSCEATLLWTGYLSDASAEWKTSVSQGISVKWARGIGGRGDAGVAGLVKGTQASLGYLERDYAIANNIAVGVVATSQNHNSQQEGTAKGLAGDGSNSPTLQAGAQNQQQSSKSPSSADIIAMLESAKSKKLKGGGWTIKHCNKNDYSEFSFDTGMSCAQASAGMSHAASTSYDHPFGFNGELNKLGPAETSQLELALLRWCAFGSQHTINPCVELGQFYEERGDLDKALAVFEYAPNCNQNAFGILREGPPCLNGALRVFGKMHDIGGERSTVSILCTKYSMPDACTRFNQLGGDVDLRAAQAAHEANVAQDREDSVARNERQNEHNREASARRQESDAQFNAVIDTLKSMPGGSDPNAIVNAGNQQAAAIRAVGDANAAQQQAAAQQRLAAQNAAQQAAQQQAAAQQAAQQAQQVQRAANQSTSSSTASNSSGSGGSGSSGGNSGTYLAPITQSCIRPFWDPKYYNWLSFENDCGQAVNLTWIAKSPNDHFGPSNGNIAAGQSANTGWSKDEVAAKGNFALFVCPAGSVAVDGTTRQMVSNPNATYSCKKQ